MSRLTEKVKNTEDYIRLATKDKQEFINKLGRIEDLEEQIGCPLEVVFKAIKNGIYTNWDWYYDEFDINAELAHIDNVYYGVNPFEKISIMFRYKKETIIDLKDYKKTWWLKEDKSE